MLWERIAVERVSHRVNELELEGAPKGKPVLGPSASRDGPPVLRAIVRWYAPSMNPRVARTLLALGGLLAVTGCQDCTWFAPEATRSVEVGGRRVRIDALATRDIGVDGFGAPHAGFGVLWPVLHGYGYRLELTLEGRPTFLAGAAPFGRNRVPNERELAGIASKVEVALSPDGDHLAYRRDADSGYRVVHFLPRGPSFDSADSDRFANARVASADLDWSGLRPASAIALRMLRDESERHAHPSLWYALQEAPPVAPLDEAVLALFPREEGSVEVLRRYTRPDARAREPFRRAILDTMLSGLETPVATEARASIVVASEDADAMRRLDERLLALFPRPDVVEPLSRRLAETRRDPGRAALRARARARGLERIEHGPTSADDTLYAAQAIPIVVAVEGRDDPPVLFEPLAARWPENLDAHRFLLEHFDALPDDLRRRLEARGRTHLVPGDPYEREGAAVVCRQAMKANRCEEIERLAHLASEWRCYVPSSCP